MTFTAHGNASRSALWLAGFIGIAFVANFWVRAQYPAAISVVGPVTAIAVMAFATLLARRQQRTLDEVQLASQGYANYQGYVFGSTAAMLLLMLPPFMNWLIDLVSTQGAAVMDPDHRRSMRLAFIYGACLVVLVQLLVSFMANAIWWRRARDAQS